MIDDNGNLFYSKYWPSPKTPPSVIITIDASDDEWRVMVKLGNGQEQGVGGSFRDEEKEENKKTIAMGKAIDLLSEMLADALEKK
jgi:hypothetical protein